MQKLETAETLKYRAVLDTSVPVSASISNGKARRLVDRAVSDKQYVLPGSPGIIAAVNKTLSGLGSEASRGALERFESVTGSIEPVRPTSPFTVFGDPDRAMVLSAAYDGRADYIVTDNQRFRQMKAIGEIPVISINKILSFLPIEWA